MTHEQEGQVSICAATSSPVIGKALWVGPDTVPFASLPLPPLFRVFFWPKLSLYQAVLNLESLNKVSRPSAATGNSNHTTKTCERTRHWKTWKWVQRTVEVHFRIKWCLELEFNLKTSKLEVWQVNIQKKVAGDSKLIFALLNEGTVLLSTACLPHVNRWKRGERRKGEITAFIILHWPVLSE